MNIAVRAPEDETVGVLEASGIGGLVGPQAGEWCGVLVSGDGFGLVGESRKDVSTVGLRLSDRVGSVVLLLTVFEGRVLGYDLFDRGKAVGYYVSRPGEWTGEELPSEGGDAAGLARACGRPGAVDEVAEVLARDAETDEVARHRRLTDLLGLPPYLVGTAYSDARGDAGGIGYTIVELLAREKRRDTGRALRIVALGLACFALYVWLRAFREGSWGTGVFALVATAVAVLAGWLSTDRSPLRSGR